MARTPRHTSQTPPIHSAEIKAFIAYLERQGYMKDKATQEFFTSPDLRKFWKHAYQVLDRNPSRKPVNAELLCEAFLVPYWQGYAAREPAKKKILDEIRKAREACDAAAQKALELAQALDDLSDTRWARWQSPIEAHLLSKFAGQLLVLPESEQPSMATLPMALERLAYKLKRPPPITAPHLRSRKSSWVDWLYVAVNRLGELRYQSEGNGVPFMPCEADWVRLASLFTGRDIHRSTLKSNLKRVVQMWCDSHPEITAENHQT